MRVLVTRPSEAGEKTAAKLRTLGHEPVLQPLSAPIRHPEAALSALALPHVAIAITSAEAIRTLSEVADRLVPFLAEPVFAVGEASADAARSLGFTNVAAAGGDGAALAARVSAHLREAGQSGVLLYLAGTPRAPGFEARLAEDGIQVTVAECYEMKPVDDALAALRHILAGERIDAVLLYSAETAKRFFAAVKTTAADEMLRDIRFCCLSSNVLHAIPAEFREKASVAVSPDETALLALLEPLP
ncbi:uroporphyrinogen-III synthase [Ciceribacter lividus]|uniref:Uroporphyrinogen-III synthase n=1 Tax=Ciceribacter lividus TaxID=1197950 RepID=A0A6I7HPD2_9HYPH|nr:uroporphyrinogen-III synthase [Ciceribacter lividus]RCW25931.1 uroporphyrinogen-III synthase [Ciceribacter lividus]